MFISNLVQPLSKTQNNSYLVLYRLIVTVERQLGKYEIFPKVFLAICNDNLTVNVPCHVYRA